MNKKNLNRKKILTMLSKDGQNFEHYRQAVQADIMPLNLQEALASAKPNALSTPVQDFRSPSSAATFDILLTRDSADLALTLPVPIFGVLDQESDWTEILSQYLTSGTTYTVARNADKKSLSFTFTNGGVSDIITVSCNQVPYVNLLVASTDSVFKMSQIKMQISDVAEQAQFSQAIGIFARSMFGLSTKDTITPNQYKSDLQNQNDIRTINQIITIDKERTMVVPFIDAAITITLSAFVQKYDKGQSAIGF